MLPLENFERYGAIWFILKCNLEENNVMKINNRMRRFFFIITHINKTTTTINYLHNDQDFITHKNQVYYILSSVIAIQSLIQNLICLYYLSKMHCA